MGNSPVIKTTTCCQKENKLAFKVNGSNLARYSSVLTISVLLLYLLYPAKPHYDGSTTSVFFFHLMSFAAHFGAQFWVTFIAGFMMFFNLPRIMFGRVQSRLFPVYFATTLVLSCVTLVTFTMHKHSTKWTSSDQYQVTVLTICVISTFINSFFMVPEIVKSLVTVFEMEKISGVAYEVGYVNSAELRKDPEYSAQYKKFRLLHGVSGIANIVTLVCNLMYLYQLASMCTYLNIKSKGLY